MPVDNCCNEYIIKHPKYLFVLIISYTMFVVMSNWYDSKLIEIFGVSITPGALIYSLTFLQSNIITEVYGFKNAKIAIIYALMFNALFIGYGFLVMYMPSPADIPTNDIFDNFLWKNTRIIGASFAGYCIAEPLNAWMVSRLKIWLDGKYVGIRFITSTFFSGLLDTALFMPIAFYGVLDTSLLINISINVWLIKAFIEILFLPISIRIQKKLKNIEKLDIYDTDTKFTFLSLFSLDTSYTKEHNKYKEPKDI